MFIHVPTTLVETPRINGWHRLSRSSDFGLIPMLSWQQSRPAPRHLLCSQQPTGTLVRLTSSVFLAAMPDVVDHSTSIALPISLRRGGPTTRTSS